MTDIVCIYCGSENIYFSKKKQIYCCEDCEKTFNTVEDEFSPQRVFISYGHDKNRVVVEAIKHRLLKRGHNPWIDSAEITEGSNWRSKISNGVFDSDEFLAFISHHSVRDPGVCLDEIAIALGRKECVIQSILLEKDVYPPNSICNNQWLDFSDWETYFSKGEMTWNNWLDKKMEVLYKVIENPDNITKSGEINDIVKKLQPITPQLILKYLLNKEIVQRKWLLDKAKNWLAEDKKVFLLVGRPGTGKSIFSALMSNYLYNVDAVYFIEWKNVDTQISKNFICSIAFQIACVHQDYRESLIRIISSENLDDCTSTMLCDKIIIKPLSEMINGNREKLVIIIDAVDELKDNYAQEFLSIVERIIEMSPSWIRCIITSRPEVSVLTKLMKYNPEYLDFHKKEIKKDIYEYIGKKYDDPLIRDAIYRKSEGSFAYVGELLKAIEGREITVEEINKLPTNIAALFYDNFERVIGKSFDDDYYKLLAALVYSYEPLTINLLAKLLDKDARTVTNMLHPLNSYLYRENINDEEYIGIGHKSLTDWLTSPQTEKYHVIQEDGHTLFSKLLLKLYEEDKEFAPYMAKYGYDHLANSKYFDDLDFRFVGEILEKSIQYLKRFGLLYDEKRLLDIYKESGHDEITWAGMQLEYSIRANGKTDRKLCETIYEYSRNEADAKKRYEMREKVANGYFYLGEDEKSYSILMKEREENSEIFEDKEYEAMWNHSISLPAHDMDFNEQVVKTSETSAKLYLEQNKRYEYFVSLVNLFDAYMGCGRLAEAERCAQKVCALNEKNYYVHIDDVLKICYANLLQVQGRIMESLKWYEEGLQQAREIQVWDYLYGSVWRELAVAKFGDKTCLDRLEEYINSSRFQDFTYVVSLGECFYILSSWLLHNYDFEKLKIYYSELKQIGLAGHNLQAAIAMKLISEETGYVFFEESEFKNALSSNIDKAQGIKGLPEVIHAYFSVNKETLSEKELCWYDKYIVPVIDFKDNYRKKLKELRTDGDTPYFRHISCGGCEAKCCYDGVYFRDDSEEKKIGELIKQFPEYFANIPEDYAVQGNWPGMEQYRKTAVRPHEYKCDDFPKHFNRTSCVFSMETGECLLQRVATDNQLHPWHAKPFACWSFPIRGVAKNEGKIISPTEYGEMDPDYIDENYPGYVTSLPCGKPVCLEECSDSDVSSWTELFVNEIEYYDYLIRNDKI